jgi:hypothetical protein
MGTVSIEMLRAAKDWIDVCRRATRVAICNAATGAPRSNSLSPFRFEHPPALISGDLRRDLIA